jgi:hypothetical protein
MDHDDTDRDDTDHDDMVRDLSLGCADLMR